MSAALVGAGLSKQYGETRALRDVTLELHPGRIHALVGENGAGKSTLTKILTGLERPDEGRILIAGQATTFSSRQDALAHGIGLVPQQLSLNPEMSVVDNYLLTASSRITRRRAATARLREVISEAGFNIDPKRRVRDLVLAERQFAELAITLAAGARFLLLDEPTSALGPFETSGLFARLLGLAESGTGILLITHRIDEVRQVADEVTVLRGGERQLHSEVGAIGDRELATAMVGAIPERDDVHRPVPGGEVVLRIDRAGISNPKGQGLDDIDLRLVAGEVLGVIGVAGNGQRELARLASGFVRATTGEVSLLGRRIDGRPHRAFEGGLRFVPEDRRDGLLGDQEVVRSASLIAVNHPEYRRFGRVLWAKLKTFTEELMEEYDVRPRNPSLRTDALSGGNQQKLLTGRELQENPVVAVLHGPTQGLDLFAAGEIRRDIRTAVAHGTGVLLISADTDEVIELADRIAVLSKGRITDVFAREELDRERLGAAMSGAGEVAR